MNPRSTTLDDRTQAYLERVGWREHPAQKALRELTDGLPDASMRSSAEQMALLGLMIEAIGATRVLEIGCFTGYGALAMALALPPDGRVTTLDVNEHWPAMGRRYWEAAGVAGLIELRLGLAEDSLRALLTERGPASFDLAYVDADKKLYETYFDLACQLVRPGGIIALDNMLWYGRVADPDDQSRQTQALRRLTQRIHGDDRLTMVLLPVADGLMVTRKRLK